MADEGNTEIVDWLQELLSTDPGSRLPDEGHQVPGDPLLSPALAAHQIPTSDGHFQDTPRSLSPLSAATSVIPAHPPSASIPLAHSSAWAAQGRSGEGTYPFSRPPPVQSGAGGWGLAPSLGNGHPSLAAARPNQPVSSGAAVAGPMGRGAPAGHGGPEGYRYGEIARLLEWERAQRPPRNSGVARGPALQQGGYAHPPPTLAHPPGMQALHFHGPARPSAPHPAADAAGMGRSPSRPHPPLHPSPQISSASVGRPAPVSLAAPLTVQSHAQPSLTEGLAGRQIGHLPRVSGPAGSSHPQGVVLSKAASTPPRPSTTQEPPPAARSPALILREALSRGEPSADTQASRKRARVEYAPKVEPPDPPAGGGLGVQAGQVVDAEPRAANGRKEGSAGAEGGAAPARPGELSLPSSRPGSEGSADAKEPPPQTVGHGVPKSEVPQPRLEAKEAIEWQAKREQFGSLMTRNLLRMATCPDAHGGVSHSSMEATTASLRTEQASLRVARQATLMRIQELQQLLQVQEEAEMSVRRLLATLDQQRASHRQGGLDGDLTDVLRVVQHLNAVCRTGPLGPNHYFTSSYASRCCKLPFLSRREPEAGITWLSKQDESGQHAILERAFAFANGDQAAGEVVMQLSKPVDHRDSLALKDVPSLNSQSYHRFTMDMFNTFSDLVEKLEAEVEGPVRQDLEAKVNLALAEYLAVDHIYFVARPLYYKRQEHWLLSEDASFKKGREAAMTRAVESLRRTGADLESMRGIWEERRLKLGPLKAEMKRVRRCIGGLFAELSKKPVKESVDYSDLMAAVAELNRCVDDAHVLLSVAISASNLCVLTSYQMALAMKAAYPHIICYEQLLPIMEIPMEDDAPGFLDSKAVSSAA